jgi:hypothetical protein
MTTPKFDSTINLGSVLTLATLLFGTGIFYARHEAALVDHDKRLVWLEAQATLIDLLRSQRHATHPASQP